MLNVDLAAWIAIGLISMMIGMMEMMMHIGDGAVMIVRKVV